MLPKNRLTTHPGEVLREEFLVHLDLTQVDAEHLEIPVQRINEIVSGKRGITPETAWLFSQAFTTTPEFWITLQSNYDLTLKRPHRRVPRIKSIPRGRRSDKGS